MIPTYYPKHYICYKTPNKLPIDGTLSAPEWDLARWSEDFVDIEGAHNPSPRFRTRMKMLWDEQFLYVGVEMEEPKVWNSRCIHQFLFFSLSLGDIIQNCFFDLRI
jgi:hypothetical protein